MPLSHKSRLYACTASAKPRFVTPNCPYYPCQRMAESESNSHPALHDGTYILAKFCYLQSVQHANVSEDAPYKRGGIKHKTRKWM